MKFHVLGYTKTFDCFDVDIGHSLRRPSEIVSLAVVDFSSFDRLCLCDVRSEAEEAVDDTNITTK